MTTPTKRTLWNSRVTLLAAGCILTGLSGCKKEPEITPKVTQSNYDDSKFWSRLYNLNKHSYENGLLVGYTIAMEDVDKTRKSGSYVPFTRESLNERGASNELAPNPKNYK